MEKKAQRLSIYAGAAAAFIAFFFDWRISSGIALGLAAYALYLHLLSSDVDRQIRGDVGLPMALVRSGRLLVFAAALFVGGYWPAYFNIFGVFGGLLAFKVCLLIISWRP